MNTSSKKTSDIQLTISELKHNPKSVENYETLAEYLIGHKREETDITGINLNKLLRTKAASQVIAGKVKELGECIDGIESLLDRDGFTPEHAYKHYVKARDLSVGMGWNVNFTEQDLANFMKEAPVPNIATLVDKLPIGLNISKAQTIAGKRLCLAGVDAGDCYMDVKDYEALPKSWKPSVAPILQRQEQVVRPSVKLDSEFSVIVSATFASLNPTEEESAQLQTIIAKQQTIDQKTGMESIMNVIGEIHQHGKGVIKQLYEDAVEKLQQFTGRENVPDRDFAPSL